MAISILVHAIVLLFFISSSFVRPKKIDFRSKGILVGFIVALYFEMYGIPLTIYLLQPVLSKYLINFYPVPFPLRFFGSAMIFIGFVIIYLGWKKIHSKNELVKTGIYAYIRHPQYVGLLLLTLGQLIQWPTLTGILLWPGIVYLYFKLARREEEYVQELYGKEFEDYKKRVPMFLPKLHFRVKKKSFNAN